jgi:ElaB/YqjD/DUF883 family membrane-anchored ribosome-binding protein
VDQRTRIRDEIDETTDSIVEKIDQLDERYDDVKQRATDLAHDAREAVSLEHHVKEHPWPMFGAAVAVGFVIDRLIF